MRLLVQEEENIKFYLERFLFKLIPFEIDIGIRNKHPIRTKTHLSRAAFAKRAMWLQLIYLSLF